MMGAILPGASVIGEDSDVKAGDSDVEFLNNNTGDDKAVKEPALDDKGDEGGEKTEEELAAENLGTEGEAEESVEAAGEEIEPGETKQIDSAEFNKLKEAYPDINKKFPWVRKAVFEHSHYQALLPTVEDAKEAIAMRDNHETLSRSLLDGRPEILFNSLHDTDPKAVERLAANFLPVLRQGNQELYNRTIEPIVKNLLKEVRAHGEKVGNKNLELASKHIANLIFGTYDIPDDVARSTPELSEKEQQLEQREKQLETKEHTKFFADINHDCVTWIDKEIERGLDPQKAMTGLVKSAAVKYIKDEIHNALIADKVYQTKIASMYREAKRNGFPPEWSERIFSAYLGRVKPLLPGLRQKARAEALGEKIGNAPEKEDQLKPGTKQGANIPATRMPISSDKGKVPSAKKVDWNKTSDEDFLAGRISLKN